MTKPSTQQAYARVEPGDPAPWFRERNTSNPNYAFDTAAGRYLLLGFFLTAEDAQGAGALAAVEANRELFDDRRCSFFGVSVDPRDEEEGRVRQSLPGLRYFWDFNGRVSRLYGAMPRDEPLQAPIAARRLWILVDPTLRVMAVFPMGAGGDAAVFDYIRALPPPERFIGFEIPAPILVLPQVFEPAFCRRLIEAYEANGGEESGFMREVEGQTVLMNDHQHKRRRDSVIEDPDLKRAIQGRIVRRVNPELARIYAFEATRMERYIVGCYAADDGAHFRPHRDNSSRGTAHRRFAVSINLNDDFEGGELSFPEYGPRAYKAPIGAAVVFPCNLLHAVSRVTKARRYAFLPFLYNDAAAKLREENDKFLAEPTNYRANVGAA